MVYLGFGTVDVFGAMVRSSWLRTGSCWFVFYSHRRVYVVVPGSSNSRETVHDWAPPEEMTVFFRG